VRRKCLLPCAARVPVVPTWDAHADMPAGPAMPQVWGCASVGDEGSTKEYLTVPADTVAVVRWRRQPVSPVGPSSVGPSESLVH
jgi:hypothetical protein